VSSSAHLTPQHAPPSQLKPHSKAGQRVSPPTQTPLTNFVSFHFSSQKPTSTATDAPERPSVLVFWNRGHPPEAAGHVTNVPSFSAGSRQQRVQPWPTKSPPSLSRNGRSVSPQNGSPATRLPQTPRTPRFCHIDLHPTALRLSICDIFKAAFCLDPRSLPFFLLPGLTTARPTSVLFIFRPRSAGLDRCFACAACRRPSTC
jgi:hypothetical protein